MSLSPPGSREITPPPPPSGSQDDDDDDEPMSPVSSEERKRRKKMYRKPEFRKELRKSYFNLESRTNERRKELMDPKRVNDLNSIIGEGNKLFEKVELAREGNIDSRWFKEASEISYKQIESIHLGKEFDLGRWIDVLKLSYRKGDIGELDSDDQSGFDWEKIGKDISKFYMKPAPMTFMNGPLNTRLKERKTGRRTRRVKGRAEKPEVLKKDQRTETSTKYVRRMQRKLRKMQEKEPELKINLLNELIDEDEDEGFTKTIENFFYFSFLVKDNKASMKMDEDDNIFTKFIEGLSSSQAQEEENQPERSQSILKLDLELYKKMIKKKREGRDAEMEVTDEDELDDEDDEEEDSEEERRRRKRRKKKKKKKRKKRKKKRKKRKRSEDGEEVDTRPRKKRKR